jgi:hypothetical protein
MFSRVASFLILAAAASACGGSGTNGTQPSRDADVDAGEPAAPDAGRPDEDAGGVASPAGRGGSGGAGGSVAPRAGSPAAGSGGAAGSGEPSLAYEELVAEVTVIASSELSKPSDLAFNPYVPGELWIENYGDSSTTIIQDGVVQRRIDPEAARHFAPKPTSLAFGGRETTIIDAAGKLVEGTFATCPDSSEAYMGPTLWTSDLRIFAITKDQREAPFNGDDTGAEGPGSHIDMLHRTPNCTGIAWEGSGNIYWTYSGSLGMFVRYDFAKDHGIGNDNHLDGSEWRYAVSGIRYVPGVPSHLAWDTAGKRLYMADSGNARIVKLDPASVTGQTPMSQADNADELQVALDMTGAKLEDFVPASYGLKLPSGVELHEQRLYVSDNETGVIHRFALDGKPLGKLTIPGAASRTLAGLAFGPDGKLYLVDMGGSRILRSETKF